MKNPDLTNLLFDDFFRSAIHNSQVIMLWSHTSAADYLAAFRPPTYCEGFEIPEIFNSSFSVPE